MLGKINQREHVYSNRFALAGFSGQERARLGVNPRSNSTQAPMTPLLLRTSGQHQLVHAFLIHRRRQRFHFRFRLPNRFPSSPPSSPPHCSTTMTTNLPRGKSGWFPPFQQGGRRGWWVCDARGRRWSVLHKYLVAHLGSARVRPRARTVHGGGGEKTTTGNDERR